LGTKRGALVLVGVGKLSPRGPIPKNAVGSAGKKKTCLQGRGKTTEAAQKVGKPGRKEGRKGSGTPPGNLWRKIERAPAGSRSI